MNYLIKISNTDISLTCEENETVLEAVERSGYTMPYSCRKGVCLSCEGELNRGQVELAGKVETGPNKTVRFCVAKPRSNIEIIPGYIRPSAPPVRRQFRSTVHRVDRPTEDVSVLHLRLPIGRRVPFRAGQYAKLLLKDGESRNYSLANPPHDNDVVQLHIRHVPGGRFSSIQLPRLTPGDVLDVKLPYGLFLLNETSSAPIILLGTGTGFAPLKSMIEDLARRRIGRLVHLFWGGRRESDLYDIERANRWAERLPWFQFTAVLSRPLPGWTGETGYVQRTALATYPDLSGVEVYACGNPAMIADARALLSARGGLPEASFFADAFVPSGDTKLSD